MSNMAGLDNTTSYSPFQKKKKRPSPDQPTLSNGDKQIMKAMSLLANVLRNARREAGEATVSATRKAELEAWVERHEAEIQYQHSGKWSSPIKSAAQMSERHFGNAAGRLVASQRNKLTGRAETRSICWPWCRP